MPGSFSYDVTAVPDFEIAEIPNSGYDFRWRVMVSGERVEVVLPKSVLRALAQRAARNGNGRARIVGMTAKVVRTPSPPGASQRSTLA